MPKKEAEAEVKRGKPDREPAADKDPDMDSGGAKERMTPDPKPRKKEEQTRGGTPIIEKTEG